MKKFSFLFIALFFAVGTYAQCVVDHSLAVLDSTVGGFYPAPNHLPHIIRDSAYSQTVQGKIETGFSQSFTIPGVGFPITVVVTVDSVRLDSVRGLPSGITWSKSSNVLPGGGLGCVLFSGTTSDSVGTYPLSSIGMIWVHLYAPPFVNKDTFQYGNLQQLPAYRNYFLVVDSAPSALSATINGRTSCTSLTAGSATVTAAGGSPTDPYTYLWNNGVTSYTINNVAAGTYYVTVTSGLDTITDSVAVAGDPTPIAITVTADSASLHNTGLATISVSGGVPPYTYRWNNGDTTETIANLAPGTYRVTVRDSLGCTMRDSVVIANLAAGISTTSEVKPQINLYPNPANNLLNVVIESPVAMNARIEAIDITGKIVYSAPANISNTHYSQIIDVKQFSPGVYILQLSSESQSIHQRFVVTR